MPPLTRINHTSIRLVSIRLHRKQQAMHLLDCSVVNTIDELSVDEETR
jgi:hypothetical protein